MSKDKILCGLSPGHFYLSSTSPNLHVRIDMLDTRKLVFCFQFHLILCLMMLKIHRTSRDLLGSRLYVYSVHEGKITWEILRKMEYFLCHRKHLPLIAAESLISLCVSHPFLGMLSVPGWCICNRLQPVIYFLLTVKEEGLYQDADCWTVLIASLLAFWRKLGEEARELVVSGLTHSKHAEKDRRERDFPAVL